ncbi:MAG: hypothetical protein ACD_4C00419G0002 [uncultured bacterium (gcode 4)]|uniref:Peptidase E n=1 Tax=uncultured bacterium (gcode 4) TaxID=1234023 RepID=K2F4Y6_9BACT|nr:MAG: hypothetical protein ACD_4C00419G0002 [uncultured bacterium (gcode 4)]
MKLFLASKIQYCLEKIQILLHKPFSETKVIFIPTASVLSKDKSFVESDLNHWRKLWFIIEIMCFDNIKTITPSILSKLKDSDIIYFSWWNTFLLLDRIKKVWFNRIAKDLLNDWKIFAWSSAWAVIMWPNIYPAHNVDDMTVTENISHDSLNLIDFFVVPHFNLLELKDNLKSIIDDCNVIWMKYMTLNEEECIIIDIEK